VIQQCQTETEEVTIAAIWAMNDFYPIVSYSDAAQVDDPQVSQASCDHQIAKSLWIRQVIFLVREEDFDLKTLFVRVNGFIGQFEIGHQIDGVNKPSFPPGNHRDRAIALFGKPNLRDADLVIKLEEQIIKRKLPPLFVELGIHGGPTQIAPTFGLQGGLKRRHFLGLFFGYCPA
jgi:hypothetical protein